MIPVENQQIVRLTELNNHKKKRTDRMAENLTIDHISSKSSFCSSSSNSESWSNLTSRGKSKSEESDCRGPFRMDLFDPGYIHTKINKMNRIEIQISG